MDQVLVKSKKRKDQMWWINLIPFYPNILVGFTTSEKAFQKTLKKETGVEKERALSEGADATTHFVTNEDTYQSYIFIVLPEYDNRGSGEYAALVAHEATHVIQGIEDKLGKLGDEVEAYMLQMIVGTVLKTLGIN